MWTHQGLVTCKIGGFDSRFPFSRLPNHFPMPTLVRPNSADEAMFDK